MAVISDEKKRVENVIATLFNSHPTFALSDTLSIAVKVGSAENDDCAVFDIGEIASMVVGSDYVRGPKFDLFGKGLLSYYDLGYYLAIANLSDVAAMGAKPIGLLSVVRYPKDLTDEDFTQILKGLNDACGLHNCPVVGGDTGSAERVILSATAIGATEKGRYLLRKGAKVGDLVCTTGPIGTPGSAMIYYMLAKDNGISLPQQLEEELLRSWQKPEARIQEGLILSSTGFGHSCQDISDGLKATIVELAKCSGIGIIVDEDALPIEDSVRELARRMEIDVTALAMSASVDFELLFTISPASKSPCQELFQAHGSEIHIIGEVIEDSHNYLRQNDGTLKELPGEMWKHQSDNVSGYIIERIKAR